MDAIANYILSLCCGAIICSIILSVGNSGGAGGSLRRMICGLFLAFLAISPLRDIDLQEFAEEIHTYTDDAEDAANAGIAQTEDAVAAVISQQAEAYILDKAAALSLELEVCVNVDEETMLPTSVELSGDASPSQKQVLTDYIRETLGIEENDQQWTD